MSENIPPLEGVMNTSLSRESTAPISKVVDKLADKLPLKDVNYKFLPQSQTQRQTQSRRAEKPKENILPPTKERKNYDNRAEIAAERAKISSKGKRIFLNILTTSAREKSQYEQEVLQLQQGLAMNIREALDQIDTSFSHLNETNHKENIEKLEIRISNLQRVFNSHLIGLKNKKRQLNDLENLCVEIENKIINKHPFKKGIIMSKSI